MRPIVGYEEKERERQPYVPVHSPTEDQVHRAATGTVNDARYFQPHSCDPNCESVVENDARVTYEGRLRSIAPGGR